MSHVVTLKYKMADLASVKAAFEFVDPEGKLTSFGGKFTEIPPFDWDTYQPKVQGDLYNWFKRSVGDYPIPTGFTEADLGKAHYKVSFPGIHYEVGIIEVDKLPHDHPARSAKDKEGNLLYPAGTFVPIFDFYDSALRSKMGMRQKPGEARGDVECVDFVQRYLIEKSKREYVKRHRRAKFTETVDEKGTIQLEVVI